MTSKNKVLDFILAHLDDLEGDWQSEFEKMNIWEDIEQLYRIKPLKDNPEVANILFAFIVLAYDNRSPMLDPHKDRMENKRKILISLAGVGCFAGEFHETYVWLLYNKLPEATAVTDWYVKYQKDWRWQDVITAIEFHSRVCRRSDAGAVDAQEELQIGKALSLGKTLRAEADATMNQLRTEFLNLDTILEKENKPKVTDIENKDFMRFESWRADNPQKA